MRRVAEEEVDTLYLPTQLAAHATPQYESVVVIQPAVLLQERVLDNDGV